MTYTVRPAVATGTVQAPPSKSVTHRALLLAAHTTRTTEVTGPLRAADTDATLAGLEALGAHATDDHDHDRVRFTPPAWAPPAGPVNCANSGTTLRLLLGLAARVPGRTRFDGDASLRGRPNKPLLDALRTGGATVEGTDKLPLAVAGVLQAGDHALPPQISSQYGSSLLLSLPFLDGDSTLTMAAPVSSRPYLDLTVQTAAAFGLRMESSGPDANQFHIPGGQTVTAPAFTVEGDWSGAAFPLVAAAITGGTVTVAGLRMDSVQGDRAVLDILQSFGARVHDATVTGGELASPGAIDVSATPDLFPALAVLAACAHGTTTFVGGAALRHKESDRIAATATGLTQLGIDAQQTPDGLVVHGGTIQGGTVQGFDDHRIHMAFCVAGLAADGPVTVTDAASVAISYPSFHDHLRQLTEHP